MFHLGRIGAPLCLWTCVCVRIAFCDTQNTGLADKKYAGMCEVQNFDKMSSSSGSFGLPCQVALFSYFNFDVLGGVSSLPTKCDLCTPEKTCKLASKEVAAVMRGGCSFDTKARSAESIGYRALIIINNDPDQENFPMGAINKEYQSQIPVVMMRTSSQEYLDNESSQVWLRMSDVKSSFKGVKGVDPNALSITILEYAAWLIPGIFVLLIACWPATLPAQGGGACYSVSSLILLCLFFALRHGTYRTESSLGSSGDSAYHHSETDERIFAFLVEGVERDWLDYSLADKGIIERLGLSRDNYGDGIFIHPPLFVYTLAVLKKCVGLSLPSSILAMQGASLLLTGRLASELRPSEGAGRAGLTAMVLYSFCPLAAFCSQKVWIDNALAFYCLVVANVHSSLWKRGKTTKRPSALLFKCLTSGLLFGLLVLNCKSTGLALFPYLVFTAVPHFSGVQAQGEGVMAAPPLPSLLQWTPAISFTMLLGAACTHGPWMLLYHHVTGRWSPNAWPSAEMVATNSFIRRAVDRPWYFYAGVLLRFSPLLLVGLLFLPFAVKVYLFGTDVPTSAASRAGSAHPGEAERKTGFERKTAWRYLTLSSWPMAFLVGLSVLGVAGAGSQARFLLPAIAPLCALTGAQLAFTSAHSEHVLPLAALLLAYMGVNLMYYAILFPNLYADLDLSVIELISRTLLPTSSSPNMSTQECTAELLVWLRHHGVHVG